MALIEDRAVTPTVINRYVISVAEAAAALFACGDCREIKAFVDGDRLIVDVIEPVPPRAVQKGDAPPAAEGQLPGEPGLKGGRFAQQAAMACGERGFWTFVGAGNADEAKSFILRRCGVSSRRLLDHDQRAGNAWRELDRKYRLWLDGHDVEI
jgi:hypothetical protein